MSRSIAWALPSLAACLVAAAWADEPTARPYLPCAIERAPEWLKGVTSFDLDAFLAAPPADQDAAPLYLDALFEFSGELASCYPPGPATDLRHAKTVDRGRRFWPLHKASMSNPDGLPAAEVDAVLADHADGFAKLDAAQRRPRCVFQAGLGATALLPHAQGARQVVRVYTLKARRDVQRGDLAAAVADVKTCCGRRRPGRLEVREPAGPYPPPTPSGCEATMNDHMFA